MDLVDPLGNAPGIQQQQQQQPPAFQQQAMHQQRHLFQQQPPMTHPPMQLQQPPMPQPPMPQPPMQQPLPYPRHTMMHNNTNAPMYAPNPGMRPMGQMAMSNQNRMHPTQPAFTISNPIHQQLILRQNSQPGPSNQNNQPGPSNANNQPGPSNQAGSSANGNEQSWKGRPIPFEWYFRCGLCRRDYGSDGKSRPCFLNGDHICESCADFEIENRSNESRKIIYYAFVDILLISKELKVLLNLLTGEVHREANPFECSVCMENYNVSQNKPTVMTCGHAVCLHCYNMIENCPRCGMALVKSGIPGNYEDMPMPDLPNQQPRPFNQANTGNQFMNHIYRTYGEVGYGDPQLVGYGQMQGNQQNQESSMSTNNQSQQDSIVPVLTKHFRSFVTVLLAAQSRKRKRSQEDEEEDEQNSSLTDLRSSSTVEQNVPKVSCEECKRSVDLNDMFNCVTCSEKKICSRCMFRKHQKEKGHEVRELINDRIKGMLKETQLFTDNQYETYLGIVPNLNQKIMEEFGKLPNLLITAYDSIGSDSHSSFDIAKEKLNDCRRIGKRLEKISEDYVPEARKYIKKLTELVEYAHMKFPSPVDPFPKIKTEVITPPHQHSSQSNSSASNHHRNEIFSEENPFAFFE